jgi:translation initiation factor eIF-2B subunit delta
MGNAIRDFKDAVVKVDPSLPDDKAKEQLYAFIDKYIGEKIMAADAVITDGLVDQIVDNDVILTYAKSSLIEKCLLQAHASGKRFKVIAVDSKPRFEGKCLAHDLAAVGIAVQYYMIEGAAHAMAQATKVFLGAHAMLADGQLYSRIGTAVVAMLAHNAAIPVVVGCQSFKFSDKVFVDAFAQNDLGSPDELLGGAADRELWHKKAKEWAGRLQVFNPMFDLTPADHITGLVTEHGELGPSAVPSILRRLERAKAT